MTPGTVRDAEALVGAPRAVVLGLLLDVRRLALWNPALSRPRPGDGQGVVGRAYRTRVRGVVPARLAFHRIEDDLVEHEISCLGSRERGLWRLREVDGTSTRIRHTFRHSGVLAHLAASAFVDVAERRVQRLSEALLVER